MISVLLDISSSSFVRASVLLNRRLHPLKFSGSRQLSWGPCASQLRRPQTQNLYTRAVGLMSQALGCIVVGENSADWARSALGWEEAWVCVLIN